MTNFILSSVAAVIVAVATFTLSETEPQTQNHLSQAEQVAIYKQAMDAVN